MQRHRIFFRFASAAWLALGVAACNRSAVAVDGASVGPYGSMYWVYHNGAFKWPGDWSWQAKVDYWDTAGIPAAGRYDIAVTVTGGTGGWQPYVASTCQYRIADCLNITPYKYLIFSLKPTVADARWAVNILSALDTPDGRVEDIAAFAQSTGCPTIGRWCNYKIPLAAFALTNSKILKFSIQDQSGPARFYVDEVGFSVD